MSIKNLHNLFGIFGKSINWKYPILFFGAMYLGILYKNLINPYIFIDEVAGIEITIINVNNAWFWLSSFISIVTVTLLAVLFLYYIKNEWIAVLATVISQQILIGAVSAFIRIQFMKSIGGNNLESFWFYFTDHLYIILINRLFFWGGLILALRYIKSLVLALVVGFIIGSVFLTIPDIFSNITWTMFVRSISYLISDIIAALVLYLGLVGTNYDPIKPTNKGIVIDKGLYQVLLFVFYGLPFIQIYLNYFFLSQRTWEENESTPAILLTIISLLFLIGGIIIFCRLIYKMWSAIQDKFVRTTPAKAVGFLFIPFFNFYWVFQVFYGFSADYNKYIDYHNISVEKLKPTIFIVFIILAFLSLIFMKSIYISMIIGLISITVFMILVTKIGDAVNAICKN